MKKDFTLGIALGGGSARGIAHIGVLKALEENGIKPNLISGTSAGAIVGALYCCGVPLKFMEEKVSSMSLTDWVKLTDFSLFRSGFLSGDRLIKFIKKFGGAERDFSTLQIPFSAIATDINTGEKVMLNKGPLWPAVRASFSIPIIFGVVRYENRFLVDGGLSEIVPAASCRQMGADFVIAVNVLPTNEKRLLSPELMSLNNISNHKRKPGLVRIAIHTYEIAIARMLSDSINHVEFLIEPDTKEVGSADFVKSKQLIQMGYSATIEKIDELKKALLKY